MLNIKNKFLHQSHLLKAKDDFSRKYGKKATFDEESVLSLALFFLTLALIFIIQEFYSYPHKSVEQYKQEIKEHYTSFILETQLVEDKLYEPEPLAQNPKPESVIIDEELTNFTGQNTESDKIIEEYIDNSPSISLENLDLLDPGMLTRKADDEKIEKIIELNPQLDQFDKNAYLELLELYSTGKLTLQEILDKSRIRRSENIHFERPKGMLEASTREKQGFREREEVDILITKNMPKFNFCYHRAMKNGRFLKGVIIINFAILPDGRVERNSVRIVQNTLRENTVALCIKNQIMRLRGFKNLPEHFGKYYVTQKFSYE